MNRFEKIKYAAEIMSALLEDCKTSARLINKRYDVVGQRQDYDYLTHEPIWEDEEKTIPKMVDKYEYVDIPEEEITDENKEKIAIINAIMNQLDDVMVKVSAKM